MNFIYTYVCIYLYWPGSTTPEILEMLKKDWFLPKRTVQHSRWGWLILSEAHTYRAQHKCIGEGGNTLNEQRASPVGSWQFVEMFLNPGQYKYIHIYVYIKFIQILNYFVVTFCELLCNSFSAWTQKMFMKCFLRTN